MAYEAAPFAPMRGLTARTTCAQESANAMTRSSARVLVLVLLAACQPPPELGEGRAVLEPVAFAASVPAQFSDVQLTAALDTPTAMDIAPDGRVFVCEKGGTLRVVKNGTLLAAPFVSLGVDGGGERGLLGVAFDPSFASGERWVYVYYTVPGAPAHNRVSRFRASASNADVSDGVENVLFDVSPLSSAQIHNGGAIHFGADGKLYIATGENSTPTNAQDMNVQLGKLLRINKDGSIPTDNPFFGSAPGNSRAIWALGFRNPYTFAVQPGTGRIFVNDVGQDSWEEIDELVRGKNYGWPVTEGPTSDPAYQSPFYAYANGPGVNMADCSIIGGAFYNPATPQYPADFLGKYFFGDFCSGYIKRLDPADRSVTTFATGITQLIDIKVAPDGAVHYVTLGGALDRIAYTGSLAPVIGTPPQSRTVSVGQSATFSVSASGGAPLAYQWQRNGAAIAGATAPSYTLANAQLADSGASFRVVVSNGAGSVTSAAATLTVTSNQPPTAMILAPSPSATYVAGTSIAFAGAASDAEDGNLPGAAFTWKVDLHHDSHSHPILGATTGSANGSFVAGDRIETSANVFYRITLTVTDSAGLATTVVRDVQPVKSTVTLATVPAGLQVKLDGTVVTTPFSFVGVAGVIRSLEAVSPQAANGQTLTHASWSDGGAARHEITTPTTNATYVDTYAAVASGFVDADVGAVGQAGSSTTSGGTATVRGSGSDIWDAADSFHFTHRTLVGDGTITARVVSVGATDGWAKGGVMVRESLATGSRHAFMALTSGNGVAFQRRESTGGASLHTGVAGGAPVWVRLVRAGNRLSGYRSSDGVAWTLVGESVQTLPASLLVGLAVTAHNNAALNSTSFDNVSVQPVAAPAFTAVDVGAVGLAGSTQASGGTVTVRGAGGDIYNAADAFQFYYRSLSGDGEIRARVGSMGNTHQWAKAGVMIRESLAPGARQAYAGLTPANGTEFLRRLDTDGATTPSGVAGGAPYWVRLVRAGNVFTAYVSPDGNAWSVSGSATIVMGADVKVGLAVCSHDAAVLNTATFDSVTVVD
jgi:glucose/arabinose dehydrogenase/regulation of enolase protein 1 (concanavalin A-like superfamily)